jgi:type II secretory pathway pseudopilin PulG
MKGINLSEREKMLFGFMLLIIVGTSALAGFFAIQYSTTRAKYERLQNQYNSLQNQLSSLESMETQLREELRTAEEDEIPDLQSQLNEIQEQKAELEARISELEEALDQFQKQYIRGFKLTELYWETGYRDWTEEGSFEGRTNVIRFTAGDYDCKIISNFRAATYGEIVFDLNQDSPHEVKAIQIVFKSGDNVAFVISEEIKKETWQKYKIEFNCRHSKFSYYEDGYLKAFNSTYQNDVDSIDTIEINTRIYKDYRMAIDLQHLEAFHIDPSAEPTVVM